MRTGRHYFFCLSVCVCAGNIVVFTDCGSCTRPISTNPGSIEASEYGLTRGRCFVARRLELVAVAGLLYGFRGAFSVERDFFVFFFQFSFFFEHTRPAASMRPPCLIFLYTSYKVVFAFRQKSLFVPGCVQGAIIKFVCRCMCVRV